MRQKIKILDLFSGIGGFSLGLRNAGFELSEHYFSEIDKHAIANYKYNFPNAKYIGSVTDIPNGSLRGIDIITFGSPCFVRDTKVITDKGYINIQDVKVGDKVLTHNGNWCNVYQVNEKEYKGDIHTLKFGKDTEVIKCTPEHPFYVVKKKVVYNSKKRNYDVIWSEPFWIEAQYLDKSHYVVVANQKEDISLNIDVYEAYLLGYYLAEGYLDKTLKKNGKPTYRIYFCMNEDVKTHFYQLISKLKYKGVFKKKQKISVCFDDKYEGKGCKAVITNKYLYELCEKVGRGAMNKIVPSFILTANKDIQKAFLDGYMFGDGYYNKLSKNYQCQSKNIEMAYGIRHLVLRVYEELASIFFVKVKSTKTINGRVVNQRPYYSIKWCVEKSKEVFSHNVNGYVVVKIISNEKRISNEPVFNFSVERDNTYIVGNYVVHNCQDFSLAGKRKGLEGDRSSLIREAIRLITDIRPDIFIWENVKGAFSSNAGEDFWAIIQAFTNIGGYRLEWQLLNTSWFLPQNRERIYLVGHLATAGRSTAEVFPIGEDDSICLQKKPKHQKQFQTQYGTTITAPGNIRGYETFVEGGTWRTHKDGEGFRPVRSGVCPTIPARAREDGSGQPVIRQLPRGNNNGNDFEVCPTISASHFDRNNFVNCIRRLTPIECERLQGFPQEYYIEEENIIMTATEKNELIFKAIKEGYLIVEGGNIFRTRLRYGLRGKEILIGSDCNGYKVSSLHIDGVKIQVKHHRIIWIYYNGIYDAEKFCINHINEDKSDNRIENLELTTFSENSSKSTKNRNPTNQKIFLKEALLIYKLHKEGNSLRKISEILGVSKSTIGNVLKTEGWTKYGVFDGKIKEISDTQRYKMIGNAVTVRVVEEIGKKIINIV